MARRCAITMAVKILVWDPGGALDHAHRVLKGARRGGLGPGHRAGSAWQGSSLDGCAH